MTDGTKMLSGRQWLQAEFIQDDDWLLIRILVELGHLYYNTSLLTALRRKKENWDCEQRKHGGRNEGRAVVEWRSGSTCLTSAANRRNMNQTIWVKLCPSDYCLACSVCRRVCVCVYVNVCACEERYTSKCHEGKAEIISLRVEMSVWV